MLCCPSHFQSAGNAASVVSAACSAAAPAWRPTHLSSALHCRRYGRNWLKVRAPGLTQYDSLLLVDSDVAVVGPIHSLFSLPVEFAAVWDQSKWLNRCAALGVLGCSVGGSGLAADGLAEAGSGPVLLCAGAALANASPPPAICPA